MTARQHVVQKDPRVRTDCGKASPVRTEAAAGWRRRTRDGVIDVAALAIDYTDLWRIIAQRGKLATVRRETQAHSRRDVTLMLCLEVLICFCTSPREQQDLVIGGDGCEIASQSTRRTLFRTRLLGSDTQSIKLEYETLYFADGSSSVSKRLFSHRLRRRWRSHEPRCCQNGCGRRSAGALCGIHCSPTCRDHRRAAGGGAGSPGLRFHPSQPPAENAPQLSPHALCAQNEIAGEPVNLSIPLKREF